MTPSARSSADGIALMQLRRRAEFLRVAAAARRAATPGLVLQAAEQRRETRVAGSAGVGYTVSRKVGGAVERNRARRRLRAAARQVMPRHAQPGFDYVLIGRAATLDRPFPALLADLEQALKRVGAWRADHTTERGEAP